MTAGLPDRAADRERECTCRQPGKRPAIEHAKGCPRRAPRTVPLSASLVGEQIAALAARRLATAPDGGTYAFHCRDATCSAAYRWTLTREGDVVTTWACDRHLAAALAELIEDRGPDTRVIVTAALAARPAPDDGEARIHFCRCSSLGLCAEHAAQDAAQDAAPSSPGSGDALHGKLAEVLRQHHPIMRSETGPFSGCRCGQVRLGQDVIAHVTDALLAATRDGEQA